MSKSQIKRLHDQQELERNSAQLQEEEPEEQPISRRGPANRFAFFDDEDGNSSDKNENSDDAEKADSVKKDSDGKKKANAKKNKKKKNKQNKKDVEEESEEQLLERMVLKNRKEQESGSSDMNTPAVESLMKVDPKLFDPSAELKKLLGKALKESGSRSTPRNTNQRLVPIGRIVKSKISWPPVSAMGLSMVFDRDEHGAKWFKFVHNNTYQQFERLYWYGEDTMNIDTVQEVLMNSRYHLNSLLMIANMMRMQDDVTQSADTIERGIFYCEQMFASQFQPFSWTHRIDYLDYENRAFYLLLHRHMLNASSKRCFETALNTAKFIFKLDPQRDPLVITMIIDTLALKARQYSWLLQFYDAAVRWKNLMLLPNWKYSVALATFLSAKTDPEVENASEKLESAIVEFPSVINELLDELQVHPDSLIMNHEMLSAFAANKEPDGLKLVTKIYMKESAELWKVPETLNWLETVTRKVASDKSDELKENMNEWQERRERMFVGKPANVNRLAYLLGHADSKSISNPFPPSNGRETYKRSDYVEARADDSFLAGLIHSLHPEFALEHNLGEAINRNMEAVRERINRYINGNAPDVVEIPDVPQPQGEPENDNN